MTCEFENMLYLFGCGATGQQAKTQYCENLPTIRKFALEHEVWDVVYSAVREKLLFGEIEISQEDFLKLENLFAVNIAANIQRVEFNLSTVKKIIEAGIKCCVLKGAVVASFYAVPEARVSSDTDILIDENDEAAVCEILQEIGYSLEERSKYDHHRKAHHKKGGLLEVHVKLHSEATREFVLDDEIHYNDEYMLLDSGIYTLSIRDGLMYLSAHLIKHFVNDGVGVRQIMDLLLYMKKHDDEIDWESYNSLMRKLNYDKLIAVVKGIGVKYFGMDFDDAITSGNGFEEVLDDMEKGGLFGSNEEDRRSFYYYYTRRRSKSSNLEYTLYQLTRSETSSIKLLFPSYRNMVNRYKYLKKLPFFLPAAWIYRIFKIAVKRLGASGKAEELSDVNRRRLKMIEKLGMVKE